MSQERAALDRALARKGETITLRRQTGSSIQAVFEVTGKAIVRGYSPRDLIGGITQTDSLVIMSPTNIFGAQWPGGRAPGSFVDPRIPVKGDRVIIQGRVRMVEAVGPVFVGDELVRIEMRVVG